MLIIESIGIGILVAMRSMTLPAAASDYMAGHRTAPEINSGVGWWLGRPEVALLTKVMAVGEMAADKLPFMPNRTAPVPLTGRIVVAAAFAAALSRPRNRVLSAIIAGLSAAIASFVLVQVRLRAVNDLSVPPLGAALAEDATVIGGSLVWRALFNWNGGRRGQGRTTT